jgi:phage/plasmid-like protein (TIGR03299 family)
MAHELSIRANGFAEMAFVGQTPWHELGQSVKQGASIGEWTRAAGMDWQAMSAPATFLRADGTTGKTDKKVIYRSDTGKALSVMGADYQIVQPLDILEFFRSATENGGWHIHTAGVLREGRKLWAMASQDDNGALVAKGDRVKLNLLLSTSLDGTAPTTARATTVRVVCANTLAAAIGEARAAVRLSHRSVFDPAVILSAMQTAGDDFASFVSASQRMAETPISLDEARDVLRKLFVSNAAKAGASSVVVASASAMAAQQTAAMLARFGAKPAATPEAPKDHRNMARVLELFQGAGMGADSSGAKGTRWGLLNAVSQFVDHEAGRTTDARIDAAWFGKGDALKSRAAELLAA